MSKGSVQMGGAFLWLWSFFKKEGGVSVFWAVFSYFSSMDFLVLTKEDDDDDDDDDENASIR